MNRLSLREVATLQTKDLARSWGEKAGWSDDEPLCPYSQPVQCAAWWEGFRSTRAKRQQGAK